jgi:hypothetical protein
MAGKIAIGFTGPRDLVSRFYLLIARTTILFLFVFIVGCLETDDCIQHVNMDSNGDIYYTFEGESCGEVVYPTSQTPVMVQFDDSYFANMGTVKDSR